MDISQITNSLLEFNGILISHLSSKSPVTFVNNYVKPRYIFTSLLHNSTTIDFTISYDDFYRVPVLHFRTNGLVNCENKYCTVDMHPILQLPYIMIHPCETALLMETIGPKSPVEYLCSWFGIHFGLIFPDIELRVPLEIWTKR